MSDKNEELKLTVAIIVDLDEPEALLSTLRDAVEAKAMTGAAADPTRLRWLALSSALRKAKEQLDLIESQKPKAGDTPPEAA